MSSLTQKVIDIIKDHIFAQYSSAQADAVRATELIAGKLQKIDAEWIDTEQKFSRSVKDSPSQSWTDSLVTSHADRQRKYVERRADLAHRLLELSGPPPTARFDEKIVESAISTIESEISVYATFLAIKRRQNEFRGEYGHLNNERWLLETRKFVTKNPSISTAIAALHALDSSIGLGIIWEDFVVSVVDQKISPATHLPIVDAGDGIGFERACAEILEQHGWIVTFTQATGDQGVDLLARQDGTIVAVQCKNTAQPVGNAAVQEVFAGKAFYEANAAVVVSRAGFTSSATQLANRLAVKLLDPIALTDLTSIYTDEGA